MARPPSTQPTDGEMEILKVLWRTGPAELGVIRSALQETKPVATTTVATMLKVMQQKGLVERTDGPRGYHWSAAISLESTRSGMLKRLIDLAFNGSAHQLISHMVDQEPLSEQDRQAIKQMLDETPAETQAKPKPRPRGKKS